MGAKTIATAGSEEKMKVSGRFPHTISRKTPSRSCRLNLVISFRRSAKKSVELTMLSIIETKNGTTKSRVSSKRALLVISVVDTSQNLSWLLWLPFHSQIFIRDNRRTFMRCSLWPCWNANPVFKVYCLERKTSGHWFRSRSDWEDPR